MMEGTGEKSANVSNVTCDDTTDPSDININSIEKRQEYETQYFNFTPKSFSDGMYNAMLEFTVDSYMGLKRYLLSEYSPVVSEEQMEKATEIFMPKVTGTLDKAFDKFESYIWQNIFSIPPHVLLPEDEVHRGVHYTQADVQSIDTEIDTLMDKLNAAKYMNSAMRQEIENCDKTQKCYDKFLQLQNQMEKTCFNLGVADLKGALVFNNERAAKIRTLIPKLQAEKNRQTICHTEKRQPDEESKTDNILKLKKLKT